MSYEVIVCVKQVPHPDYLGKITFEQTKRKIQREGIPAVINPADRNAIEEALKIRDRFSGRVVVLTMGPPQARKALENALAMGADSAIHLCDPAFAGADTLATARTLAYALRKLEYFDIVLCGDATIDSGTGQLPIQLAEFLNVPCVTDAEELTFKNEQSLLVKRKWERGYIIVEMKLPAVIAVSNRANQPRLPTVLGIMSSTQKEITTWNTADISADIRHVGLSGSPSQVFQMSEFHAKRQGEILQGSPEEVVTLAMDKLVRLEIL